MNRPIGLEITASGRASECHLTFARGKRHGMYLNPRIDRKIS